MSKQGRKGKSKRPAASTKGNTKKKSKPRGNVVGGSKLLDPKHNKAVAKVHMENFLYDPVIPELYVACRGVIFKLKGRQSKAVFHFEVRGYSEAHHFKERGVDQICPAFRLTDCTDYESKEMTDLFGENENPWGDIWMPSSPTYNATRDATWKARPRQRELALRQKDVYERNKTELLTGGAGAGGAGTQALPRAPRLRWRQLWRRE